MMSAHLVRVTSSLPEAQTLQEISGTLSIIVEVIMVLVNLLPVVYIIRHRNHTCSRSVTDDLILTLSITCVLSVVIPTPVGVVSYFRHHWVGGLVTCQFYRVTTLWFQLTAMLLTTCLCFERFLCLRATLFYTITIRTIFTHFRVLVVCLYMVSLTVACLPVMGLAPTPFAQSSTVCNSWFTAKTAHDQQNIFFVVFLFFGYGNFVSSSLICLRLSKMLLRYRTKFTRLAKSRDTAGSASIPIDRKCVMQFTRMALAVNVLFYLTWFPTIVMVTLRVSHYTVSEASVMYAFLATRVTSLINPLLYPLFSTAYRRGYRTVISDVTQCLVPCCVKQFQALPAITGSDERDQSRVSDTNPEVSASRSNLRRSRSLDRHPKDYGLYNAAYNHSLYSNIDGLCTEKEDCDLAQSMKTIRRARSLSPTNRFMISRDSYQVTESCGSSRSSSVTSLALGVSSRSSDSDSDTSDEDETRI